MDFIIDKTRLQVCSTLVDANKNVLIVGATGSGKTSFGFKIAEELGLNPVAINCGSTQDARISFIGSYRLRNGNTEFIKADFIRNLQKPNTLIILDEISRSSDDAQNLLLPILDFRAEVKIDETDEVIQVDPSVRFLATANLGAEYSAINSIDRALFDRFTTFHLEYMAEKELVHYILKTMKLSSEEESKLKDICAIYGFVNKMNEQQKMITRISPRMILNCTSLLGGFTVKDIFDTVISSTFGTDDTGLDDQMSIKQFMDAKGFA